MITHTLIVPQNASNVTFDLSGTQGKRCMRVELYGKPVEEEGRHQHWQYIKLSCVNYQPESIIKVFIRRAREASIRRGWGGAVGKR